MVRQRNGELNVDLDDIFMVLMLTLIVIMVEIVIKEYMFTVLMLI